MVLHLSNWAKDRIAPQLSQLSACGAEPLGLDGKPLASLIVNGLLFFRYPEEKHPLAVNYARRIEQAVYEYENGRTQLQEYVATPDNVISPYFRAFAHFEHCLASLDQALELGTRLFRTEATRGHREYASNDGSVNDRINRLHRHSKHMDERIESGKLPPEGTTAVWITNRGIESTDTVLTFAELRDDIRQAFDIAIEVAERIPAEIVERQRARAAATRPGGA